MSGTIRILKPPSGPADDDVTVPRNRDANAPQFAGAVAPNQGVGPAGVVELSSSALAEEVEAQRSADDAKAGSLVGTMISGRYRIDELIGQGGMGAVYRGEQVLLRKRVAIKVLQPGARRLPALVARFEREAIAGAHIHHPNVVSAIDFGQLEDQSYFLVLEYVQGTPLKDAIVAGRLPVGRALRIARQIALALDAVHAKGIVHRDIKPQNVLLEAHDDVKLIDFGFAKLRVDLVSGPSGAAARPDPALTTHGELFGTLAYLAPEAAHGMDTVDARADLYALGIVLYEMLSGRFPFDATDGFSMYKHQRFEDPPPLSVRAPELHVTPEVEAIVMRLIQRDPSLRYQAAAELIAAIDGALAALERAPAAAQNPSGLPKGPASFVPIESDAARVRRFLLVAATGALLVIGGVLLGVMRSDEPPAAGEAPSAQPAPPASKATEPPAQAAERAPAEIDGADAAGWRAQMKRAIVTKNWPLGAKAIVALARLDPKQLGSAGLRADVITVTTGIGFAEGSEPAEQVFDVLANQLGTDGLDILFEVMRSRGGSKAGRRAGDILSQPEVMARASPGLRITYDFRKASCTTKRELLDRAAAEGDRRTLGELQILNGSDCRNPKDPCCFREDKAMTDAIRKLQDRLGT